jgi:hypothetical protein
MSGRDTLEARSSSPSEAGRGAAAGAPNNGMQATAGVGARAWSRQPGWRGACGPLRGYEHGPGAVGSGDTGDGRPRVYGCARDTGVAPSWILPREPQPARDVSTSTERVNAGDRADQAVALTLPAPRT